MRMIGIFASLLAVSAAPFQINHNLHLVKRATTVAPFYYPESSVKSLNVGDAIHTLSSEEMKDLALETIAQETNVQKSQLRISNIFTDAAQVTHVYIDRMINDVVVSNHNAAVHIQKGQVSSFTASFQGSKSFGAPLLSTVKVPVEDAIKTAEQTLGAPKDETEPYKSFVQINQDKIVLAHMFQIRDDKANKWMHVAVDTESGQIVEVIDYYNEASFKAIKWPNFTPEDGFDTLVNPEDKTASPQGWNNDGKNAYVNTKGNNVDVYINAGDVHGTSNGGVFDSAWNPKEEPGSDANIQASAVNLFYVINKVHDITYQYGFTEAAGNFQASNFGKGGAEGDAVKANDQSSQGTNNANFATPPDGQSGKMNMYLFTRTTPERDGSLEDDIPIHEMVHGVSNRLTGGSRNGRCLQNGESGGMGEGWSDTIAMFLLRKPTDDRNTAFALGNYVLNTPGGKGIRRNPYTTDMTVNPETFSWYKKSSEVHNLGDIWATMLNELYWNLVEKLGYSENWYDAKQNKGNIVAMQLVIGGMMLQPCNPNFTQARDAILQADVNYYKGANKCEIWKAFAKRGLGVDSNQSSHTDGFKVPQGC